MSNQTDTINIDWSLVPSNLRSDVAHVLACVADWAFESTREAGETTSVDESNDLGHWPTIDTEYSIRDGDELATVRVLVTDKCDEVRGAVRTLLDDLAWEGDLADARQVAGRWVDPVA